MAEDKHTKITDGKLVELYLQTQEDIYFDMIYGRYSSKVYAKCISILKNQEGAKDATQEIFVKVILNLAKFKQEAKLSTWIYAVTYNTCIDIIRKKKKMNVSDIDEETQLDKGTQWSDDLDQISDAELLEIQVGQLKHVLADISDQDRILLLMKYQDDLSIKDIGQIMKLSDSAVKMRLARAKQRAKLKHQQLFGIS